MLTASGDVTCLEKPLEEWLLKHCCLYPVSTKRSSRTGELLGQGNSDTFCCFLCDSSGRTNGEFHLEGTLIGLQRNTKNREFYKFILNKGLISIFLLVIIEGFELFLWTNNN